jgi:hypothetical protein
MQGTWGTQTLAQKQTSTYLPHASKNSYALNKNESENSSLTAP